MRAAVYCGTRNLYQHMVTAAKSLMIHSNVEKIYFLIQDDVFPYQLPQMFECINVSNQQYFRKDGPNYNSPWTYMILMRTAMTKLFPNLDKILSLDVDTIINENISELWDINLTNYYFAAVIEKIHTQHPGCINGGVMMLNLQKLRQDKKDDQLITALNTVKYTFPEQECINERCQNYIYELFPNYNISCVIKSSQLTHEKIDHYLDTPLEVWTNYPPVLYYKNISFKNIQRNKKDQISLDIIIPFYKDCLGLYSTLETIPQANDINIIIVDDCSPVNYQEQILTYYPYVKYYRLPENAGPGNARQFGIEHSNGSHILFLDCGDQFLSKYCIQEIRQAINNNPMQYIYSWRVLVEKTSSYINNNINGGPLHGRIYKRKFLEIYSIKFASDKKCAYANEDIGFTFLCSINLKRIKKYSPINYHKTLKSVLSICTYDKESLTNIGNNFFSTKQVPGLAYNAIYICKTLKNTQVDNDLLQQTIIEFILSLYEWFLYGIQLPNFSNNNWIAIKDYYLQMIKPYENNNIFNQKLNKYFKKHLKDLMKKAPKGLKVNIKQFLKQLNEYDIIPERYLGYDKKNNIINQIIT